MQGCGKTKDHYKSWYIRVCQLIQYKFIPQYSTDVDEKCFASYLHKQSNVVSTSLFVKERNVWLPFFDINQFFNPLNSFMVIILNTIYG